MFPHAEKQIGKPATLQTSERFQKGLAGLGGPQLAPPEDMMRHRKHSPDDLALAGDHRQQWAAP
jgi:hypothetical protein